MVRLPEKIDSKFRFVLLAAQRAEQMLRGARPKRDDDRGKASKVAMGEITEGLVEWDYGQPEEPAGEELTEEAEA